MAGHGKTGQNDRHPFSSETTLFNCNMRLQAKKEIANGNRLDAGISPAHQKEVGTNGTYMVTPA